MIVIKFSGGLGNQLYQYVIYSVMRKTYPNVEIKADLSFYNLLCEHNGYELDKDFDVFINRAGREEIQSFCNAYVASDFTGKLPFGFRNWMAHRGQNYYMRMKNLLRIKKIGHIINGLEVNAYNDLVFHLNPSESWYLNGLWQNYNYMAGYHDEIIGELIYKRNYPKEDQTIKNEICRCNSVSIHVRRGDFTGSQLDICGKQYYETAIQTIKKMVPNSRFYIFSDDKEFTEKTFSFLGNKRVISHKKEDSILDMMLMSECKHNIISNSTFSYWGAMLNKNKEKIIIAPRYSIIDFKGKYMFSLPDGVITLEV